MSLNIDIQELQTYGVADLQIALIMRGSSDTLKEKKLGDDFTLPEQLKNFSALGNPPRFFTGYAVVDEYMYFTQFIANDAVIELLARGKPVKNPIHIVHTLTDSMKNLLVNNEAVVSTATHYPKNLKALQKIKGLDSLLYNLAIGGKMIFIGSTHQILQTMQTLIVLIPEQYQPKYSFAVNIPNSHPRFIGIDPQYCERAQTTIDDLVSKGYDIVDLLDNQAYGSFTTDLTVNLAKSIKDGATIQDVLSTLQATINIALSEQELAEGLMINNWKTTLADVDFLLQIRQEM